MLGLKWMSMVQTSQTMKGYILPDRKLDLCCNILPESLQQLDHTLIYKLDNILAMILEFIYKYQIHKEKVGRVNQE